MSKPKLKCMVCGKVQDKTQTVREHKFPHGSMNLCFSRRCFETVCLETQNSIPVVWVGPDDFLNSDLSNTEVRELDIDVYSAADDVSEFLWEGANLGESFSEAIRSALEQAERDKINKAIPEDLPLMIGHLKFPEENDKLLAKKLTGG